MGMELPDLELLSVLGSKHAVGPCSRRLDRFPCSFVHHLHRKKHLGSWLLLGLVVCIVPLSHRP